MGTVALRRRAFSPDTEQGGKTPQGVLANSDNRTFEGLMHGFWASRWSRSGGPIAQGNSALYRIALCRLCCDARTLDYLARRITEGKTHREAIRYLKRYIAREIYQISTSSLETQLSTV
jgi:hypothetical protein